MPSGAAMPLQIGQCEIFKWSTICPNPTARAFTSVTLPRLEARFDPRSRLQNGTGDVRGTFGSTQRRQLLVSADEDTGRIRIVGGLAVARIVAEVERAIEPQQQVMRRLEEHAWCRLAAGTSLVPIMRAHIDAGHGDAASGKLIAQPLIDDVDLLLRDCAARDACLIRDHGKGKAG